ncbi:MAG: hypothetical protein ACRD59_16035 [Candidatus Acidiferrales bacterium]
MSRWWEFTEKLNHNLIERFEFGESRSWQNMVILPDRAPTLGIMSRTLGIGIWRDVRERLARLTTEPHEGPQFQRVPSESNPYDTAARLFGQGAADRDSPGGLGLQLDVANDTAAAHHDIISVRVELRPQDLNVSDAMPPERPKHISYKYVLDDTLTERRMREVPIFRRHETSRRREYSRPDIIVYLSPRVAHPSRFLVRGFHN